MKRSLAITAALMLLLAACGSPSVSGDTTSISFLAVTTTVDPVSESEDPTDGEGVDPGLQSPIESAVVDLAQRLVIAESDVEVRSAFLVTWADSSLGCPMPGMSYAQVLTDGAVIKLGVGEDVYNYHMGGSQHTPFLCEQPSDPVPQKESTRPTLPGPIELNPLKPTDESVPPPGYDE